ncbi:hypothetical protein TSUD_164430 [Trifolium subterraneum]|uniref:Uncharacterized protein n=1 Tax=Trifolium subterraneum TaxID=3900 RepID=A0A2Z6N0W2_TRISU|nr:hypothetical protein TSUD_164430 [Trifolium subterraneum]
MILQKPECSVIIPDILEDFCLNLLDWSCSNVLSVALQNEVYFLNGSDGTPSAVLKFEVDLPTSVSWAPDGRQLAVVSTNSQSTRWLHKFDEHTAAVKALAWCPFQSNLLASGGGKGDQCIKLWDTHTGARLNSVDTGSEITALLWNKNERELLSSHGVVQDQLTLWKYPSMLKMATLDAHISNVLYMSQSPDGYTVASVGADEKLRLWKIFGTPPAPPKSFNIPFANFNSIR